MTALVVAGIDVPCACGSFYADDCPTCGVDSRRDLRLVPMPEPDERSPQQLEADAELRKNIDRGRLSW